MFQDGIGAAGFFAPGSDDERPYAYLNYLLFDENFGFFDAGAQRVDEDGEYERQATAGVNIAFDHLQFAPVTIQEKGYIYVWVSNETSGTPVYFDDLRLVHKQEVDNQLDKPIRNAIKQALWISTTRFRI